LAENRGAVVWRKSSYSGQDEQCCEVAESSGAVWVRDSKRPGGARVTFTADAWHAGIALFLAPVPSGRSQTSNV
jgi:hypothetical protein